MKLNIPEQIQPDDHDFPNHPGKVKKWLHSMQQANMGDYTRHIYNGIMHLNRQSMPAKYRLENMENLRVAARHIFDQLKKYYVNRTLPLPEKSRKIISLNQAILNEMAIGYKIMVFEAANNLGKVDSKILMVACERALHYLAELLLRCSQVYSDYPKGIWWDIHRIYVYAEQKGLHQKKIKDTELANTTTTIESRYKQILLFSLARPNALRQNDAERLYKDLPQWAEYTKLSNKPAPSTMNRYFCCKIDSDLPPNCVAEEDLKEMNQLRSIEISRLVDFIRKKIDDSDSFRSSISIGDQISQETLRTLITSWSLCAKRRFSRAHKDTDIKVSIGLSAIYESLTIEASPPRAPIKKEKRMGKMFSLESIPDNTRVKQEVFAKDDPTFFITHPNMKAHKDSAAGAWDMVAKGRTLTESYARELQEQDDDLGELNKEAPDLHWVISNVSAGGYCLQWNAKTPSKAQVGELVGIREREPDHTYQWRAGVLRWMQYANEDGLEIGVQVLSPKVIACKVKRTERVNETPFNCLMLPGIKPIQQPSTLLLPAHAFKKGDKLNIHVYGRDMEIILGTIREHTGSFTQFQFAQLNEPTKPEKDSSGSTSSGPNDFDSIWSSL